MTSSEIAWPIPTWLDSELGQSVDDRLARMRLTIRLAQRNVDEGTGGPFAAVLFERETGRVVTAGLDLLASVGCTAAHAELVAIARAQAALETADLRPHGLELYASAEPCVMCLGAILWSGVSTLVYGAGEDDWRTLGWDDLPKPPNWHDELVARGVAVIPEVLRDEAQAPLAAFRTARRTPV